MANWSDAAAMMRRSANAGSSRARQVGPAQAAREEATDLYPCTSCEELYLDHELTAMGECRWCVRAQGGEHDSPPLQTHPPAALLCEVCEEPLALYHLDRHQRVCCAECLEIGEAICSWAHAERLRVIRARAVLAREGIAGYGKTGGER